MTRSETPTTARPTASASLPKRPLLLLSGALAIVAADQTIAGAVAPALKTHFHVSNTMIGLLVTATVLMAAVTSIPFGILADRTNRVRILTVCGFVWAASVIFAATAVDFTEVLIAQTALGAAMGAATPVVTSLVGDLFPRHMRGRALGLILAGEFAGAASGLLIAGELAALFSWRTSFAVLGAIGVVFSIALPMLLREPMRGAFAGAGTTRPDDAITDSSAVNRGGMVAALSRSGIAPRERLVLNIDPARRSMGWAIRHVLAIPTNVVIIVSSALCYFYVAGVQTFAIVYLRGRFDLSQETATALLVVIGAGVIAGIVSTGHISDRLISRGKPAARPVIGGICFLAAVITFAPGFATAALWISLPFLFLGAAALGGVIPPLDAARLDVVHYRLWGRAESVRSLCQNMIKAGAPLLFGYLSVVLAAPGEDHSVAQGGGAVGMSRSFLLLLVLFAIAGTVLLVTRKAYLKDVASAIAYEERTRTRPNRTE